MDTSAGEIVTTEDHRYWNDTDHEWQASQDLDQGDQLLTATGDHVAVVGLDSSTLHTAAAYDLDVAGIDSFYVGAGETRSSARHRYSRRTARFSINSRAP